MAARTTPKVAAGEEVAAGAPSAPLARSTWDAADAVAGPRAGARLRWELERACAHAAHATHPPRAQSPLPHQGRQEPTAGTATDAVGVVAPNACPNESPSPPPPPTPTPTPPPPSPPTPPTPVGGGGGASLLLLVVFLPFAAPPPTPPPDGLPAGRGDTTSVAPASPGPAPVPVPVPVPVPPPVPPPLPAPPLPPPPPPPRLRLALWSAWLAADGRAVVGAGLVEGTCPVAPAAVCAHVAHAAHLHQRAQSLALHHDAQPAVGVSPGCLGTQLLE